MVPSSRIAPIFFSIILTTHCYSQIMFRNWNRETITEVKELAVTLDLIYSNGTYPIQQECIPLKGTTHPQNSLVKLRLTGTNVGLSNFKKKSTCNGSVVIFEIFATERIILDHNFKSFGKPYQLVLAAPILEVRGKRKIILKGRNGIRHKSLKADDGDPHGNRNGANGEDGLPGTPGGTFHGIAGKIININDLKITANGGNGSSGQNGGNGAKGRKGSNGGRGGSGGFGGNGGNAGTITFFELNSDCKRILGKKLSAREGESGDNGATGEGGPAGDLDINNYYCKTIDFPSKGISGIRGRKCRMENAHPIFYISALQYFKETVDKFQRFLDLSYTQGNLEDLSKKLNKCKNNVDMFKAHYNLLP